MLREFIFEIKLLLFKRWMKKQTPGRKAFPPGGLVLDPGLKSQIEERVISGIKNYKIKAPVLDESQLAEVKQFLKSTAAEQREQWDKLCYGPEITAEEYSTLLMQRGVSAYSADVILYVLNANGYKIIKNS